MHCQMASVCWAGGAWLIRNLQQQQQQLQEHLQEQLQQLADSLKMPKCGKVASGMAYKVARLVANRVE